ncbi:NFYB factor, partial [Horornis vulcanius]|nr:NFYB factor [Horornis vulcanius]
MDGDSSTTDASQLGIAGDYIGGSHYVIQPHDDTEDSMNDHEDTNGSKESFREQDIYLPIANVARIMKNAIPQTGKVILLSDFELCAEGEKPFLELHGPSLPSFCFRSMAKMKNTHVICTFSNPIEFYRSWISSSSCCCTVTLLQAMKGEKGIGGTVTAGDGLSEELTEEAFTNQLPAGLITTDGQQQNVMVYTTSYQQV